MPMFRKKPVVIEAEQYLGKIIKGICTLPECILNNCHAISHHVHTIHNGQAVIVEEGDYIIPEPDGIHFYPCKPDIFEKTYELVN